MLLFRELLYRAANTLTTAISTVIEGYRRGCPHANVWAVWSWLCCGALDGCNGLCMRRAEVGPHLRQAVLLF